MKRISRLWVKMMYSVLIKRVYRISPLNPRLVTRATVVAESRFRLHYFPWDSTNLQNCAIIFSVRLCEPIEALSFQQLCLWVVVSLRVVLWLTLLVLVWKWRGCLYGGEPARVPGLARFAEMNFWRVASPVGGANLFTSLTAFIFPPRPKSCFSEHVFNLKLTHEQTQLPKWRVVSKILIQTNFVACNVL